MPLLTAESARSSPPTLARTPPPLARVPASTTTSRLLLILRQAGGKAGSSTEVQAFSAMSANPLRMESYNSEVDRPSPRYQDRVVTTTKIE